MSKVSEESEAAGFWHSNFGTDTSCSHLELAAALERLCEEQGQVVPACLPFMVKHCLGESDIPITEFFKFVAVYAPFAGAVLKAADSLFDGGSGTMHPWYHGALSRGDAKAFLTGAGDGAFLIRNSSQPGKLALQFKTHGAIKNCLLHNLGERGFALSAAPRDESSIYPSVAAFVEFGITSGKFTEPIPSTLSATCNAEVALAAEEAAAAPDSSYGAFDPDAPEGGAYDPMPAGGDSNYASFDVDAGGAYEDMGPPAADAGGSNYAAFTADMDGGLGLPGDDAGAGGGGSYGMFDPTAGGDELGLPFPGDADPLAGGDGGGGYGMFVPEEDGAPAGAPAYEDMPPADAGSSSYAVFDA